jgi:hypothetical protein
LNWLTTPSEGSALRYGRLLRSALDFGQNVVVFDSTAPQNRRIDVWWFEDDSSRLALLFAYLMTRTEIFAEAAVRVWAPAPAGLERKVEANLRRRIEELRIDATVIAVDGSNARALDEHSRATTSVLLPFRIEGMRIVDGFGQPADEVLGPLPIAALIGAPGDIRLSEIAEAAVAVPASSSLGPTPS